LWNKQSSPRFDLSNLWNKHNLLRFALSKFWNKQVRFASIWKRSQDRSFVPPSFRYRCHYYYLDPDSQSGSAFLIWFQISIPNPVPDLLTQLNPDPKLLSETLEKKISAT
jgi:hypothetical protein